MGNRPIERAMSVLRLADHDRSFHFLGAGPRRVSLIGDEPSWRVDRPESLDVPGLDRGPQTVV